MLTNAVQVINSQWNGQNDGKFKGSKREFAKCKVRHVQTSTGIMLIMFAFLRIDFGGEEGTGKKEK